MSVPFSHGSDEDLQIKRNFLEIGKRHYQKSVDKNTEKDAALAYELSSALIYMNVADYLADYLSKGISELIKRAVGRYYFGAITTKSIGEKNLTIGESIRYLKSQTFQNKTEIMKVLEQVERKRNILAHEILKFDKNNRPDIDGAITELAESTEKLVELIDEIQPVCLLKVFKMPSG